MHLDKNTVKNPITLCVVTNRLDTRLKEMLTLASPRVAELLIGYNGEEEPVQKFDLDPTSAKLIHQEWQGYSRTKNALAALSQNDWIWSLDDDEIPDAALLQEIACLQNSDLTSGSVYACRRISYFEGKMVRHGAWGRDKVYRIYHRAHTKWRQELVHETLETDQPQEIKLLKGILYHYTADDRASFLSKNKKYAALSAQKYALKGKKSPLWKQWLAPLFTFIKEYFFQLGILDGKAGWQIAKINALYTYWKYQYLHKCHQTFPVASN